MAWKKAKNNQPAVGAPVLTGEPGEQVWKDGDGDVLFDESNRLPAGCGVT